MSTTRKKLEDAIVNYLNLDATLTAQATPRNYWDQSTARGEKACWAQVVEPTNRCFGENGGGAVWQAEIRLCGQTLSNEDPDGSDLDIIIGRLLVFAAAVVTTPATLSVSGVTFHRWIQEPPEEQFADGVQMRSINMLLHFEA